MLDGPIAHARFVSIAQACVQCRKDDFSSIGFQLPFGSIGLKAAGIFARLNHRDGKAIYLEDVPRTLSYVVDIAPRYPELEFLVGLIEQRVLPGLEA